MLAASGKENTMMTVTTEDYSAVPCPSGRGYSIQAPNGKLLSLEDIPFRLDQQHAAEDLAAALTYGHALRVRAAFCESKVQDDMAQAILRKLQDKANYAAEAAARGQVDEMLAKAEATLPPSRFE
jgi:hypothetical protein